MLALRKPLAIGVAAAALCPLVADVDVDVAAVRLRVRMDRERRPEMPPAPVLNNGLDGQLLQGWELRQRPDGTDKDDTEFFN